MSLQDIDNDVVTWMDNDTGNTYTTNINDLSDDLIQNKIGKRKTAQFNKGDRVKINPGGDTEAFWIEDADEQEAAEGLAQEYEIGPYDDAGIPSVGNTYSDEVFVLPLGSTSEDDALAVSAADLIKV